MNDSSQIRALTIYKKNRSQQYTVVLKETYVIITFTKTFFSVVRRTQKPTKNDVKRFLTSDKILERTHQIVNNSF